VLSRAPRPPSSAPSALADEALVARAQTGDAAAFGLLYDRYFAGVHAYCFRLLGRREASEDATTETFLRALTGLPAYRAGSFRAWLFTIARHVVIDEQRRARPQEPLAAAALIPDPAAGPDDLAPRLDAQATVRSLLPRLSPDQQQVVALRLAGLPADEIARVLGKPRNAIDGIHHRALRRAQTLLATASAPAPRGGDADV
jgi:RNA polymerase sigma-70 factor (ECF subfamily)